jgi:hypothetical protein
MTSPSETAMNQMAAEDETDLVDTGLVDTDLVETDMRETDMLQRVPAPAQPLPAETPEFPAAGVTASLSARWHEIQAMFVDDPRSSAEMAAGLVDESVQALVASVREQQDSLLAAWHVENAGTEELRTAVQHYRAFGGRLADFTREA